MEPSVSCICENLHLFMNRYNYLKELHNEQEHYWLTMYRVGANVVSTITSLIYLRVEMCMHNKCMGLLGNLKLVSWHKRTLCHPVWLVIILVIKQIRLPLCSRPILLITFVGHLWLFKKNDNYCLGGGEGDGHAWIWLSHYLKIYSCVHVN